MTSWMRSLALLCFLTPSLICSGQSTREADADAAKQLQKFTQFYRYLNGAYVDTLNTSELIEQAIVETLAQLDPHSSYLTPEEMRSTEEIFSGSFTGIGIEYTILRDTIFVVNVIVGGPAEQVGVLPNDRIIRVDGSDVVGCTQVTVPKLLRGPKDTRVEIEVLRNGITQPLHISIVRDNIPINTVDAAYKIDAQTGYIRVNRFGHNTMQEFKEAYESFGSIGALVVDLRKNGGGLLDQAVEMSSFFLPQGSLITFTEGERVPPVPEVSQRNGAFLEGKVVILTDEFSASGSEVVAGAIQDWDRGVIIGRRTFGKGLVQRQFPLNDGSAVRITIARYHTPSGRVIQRHYEMGKQDEYQQDMVNRLTDQGDFSSVDSTQIFKTRKLGRTVYGGGGITPDITVELDTSGYTNYLQGLVNQGVLIEFVFNYMDRHRGELAQRYPTINQFMEEYVVDENLLQSLQKEAEKREVPAPQEEVNLSKDLISNYIKAQIAQKLWSTNEYFMVLNSWGDPIYDKALEVLKNWDKMSHGVVAKSKK